MSHPEVLKIAPLISKARWMRAPPNEQAVVYIATVDECHLVLQINDFPQENFFTLYVDGKSVLDFDDWPAEFGKEPVDPPLIANS